MGTGWGFLRYLRNIGNKTHPKFEEDTAANPFLRFTKFAGKQCSGAILPLVIRLGE